jgi:flagellar biosynthesis GTPase FlhF
LNMANTKKTLYEILEVPPSASFAEIQAAHRLLCRKFLLGKSGLSREDIDFNLKVLDVALRTLSDQVSRDAYDAQQSARNTPANAIVPLGADAASLKTAIEAYQKVTGASQSSDDSPLKIFSATAASSASALKRIFRVIVGLAVLAVVIKVSMVTLAGRPAGGISKAEEKVILQEYYQTHGVRPGSKTEADLLEVENRRKENERREAAREKEREEERERRFVEDSRRIGSQVSENLRRDAERARYEEEQEKRRSEQEKRAREEAERNRIEEARRRAGMEPLPGERR